MHEITLRICEKEAQQKTLDWKTNGEAGQQMNVAYQVRDADRRVVRALGQISLRAALADRDQLNEELKTW